MSGIFVLEVCWNRGVISVIVKCLSTVGGMQGCSRRVHWASSDDGAETAPWRRRRRHSRSAQQVSAGTDEALVCRDSFFHFGSGNVAKNL